MKKSFFKLCILGIILTNSSCMRYTPSRASLSSGDDSAIQYAGEEAFYSLDKTQDERLKNLIAERHAAIPETKVSSYKIGVDDVIDLSVFDAPEMNRKVRVRPDGFISLPLINQIKLAGLTESDAQAEITKQLNKFMHSPQVQLYISEYAAHKVWVVGNIPKPGAYPLSRDNYSLIELLSEAGGRNEKASSTIILIPNSDGKNQDTTLQPLLNNNETKQFGIEIPFEQLIGSVDKAPLRVPLRAGDTIVVPEAGTVEIAGEVNAPGSYPLPSKMTLLGAVAVARGLSYAADVESVEVIRELGAGKKAMITVDLEKLALKDASDIRLRNGDIVRIPSDRTRFITNQTVSVINSLVGRVTPDQYR